MKLRALKLEDANRMLEWMHNDDIVSNLGKNFKSYTLQDCKDFISHSQTDKSNLNLAITDDKDNYMGTVSLKHIIDNTAEFAIVLHPKAIGLGFARFAIHNILSIGFNKLNLKEIYWNVLKSNIRAIKCYDKNGYERFVPDSVKYLTLGGVQHFFTRSILLVQDHQRRIYQSIAIQLKLFIYSLLKKLYLQFYLFSKTYRSISL